MRKCGENKRLILIKKCDRNKRSTGLVVYEYIKPMRGLHFRASTNHRPSCIHTPQTPVLFLGNKEIKRFF
jgi:hypothetical protein